MEQQPSQARRPSRARWLIPLAVLFLFMAFAFVAVVVAIGAFMGSAQPIASGSVIELKLQGGLRESPDALGSILPGVTGPPSLYELRAGLARAAEDDDIAALRLDIGGLGFGWAMAEELLAVIDQFRASGKPVVAFLRGDMVSDLDYAVSLAGTTIWIAPETAMFVNGLRAEVEFWRGTLDKLQIEPQYFMMKEYKSAGEVYSRYEMSEHFREATEAVLDDIWASFLAEVARRRQLDPEGVRVSADYGLMSPEEARAAGWVDELGYEEDIRKSLKKALGRDQYRSVTLRRYLNRTADDSWGKKLAVVFGEGVIVSSSAVSPFQDLFYGPRVASAIRKAADDDSVKAILFRVDSPGGSAVGSDHVWRAIEYARKERGKPVVATMGSLAGSGGYWVSLGADAIVARPSTITGSIGVVFGKLNFSGLYELVGAHIDSVQVGDNADILSFVSSLDEEQKRRVLAWMEHIYANFKAKVASARDLDQSQVEEIAKGRIWSGVDAVANGLVDRLGGYDEAIELARELADLDEADSVRLVVYPKPQTLFEMLLSEDGLTHIRYLVKQGDPQLALRRALDELARPGALALAPTLRID